MTAPTSPDPDSGKIADGPGVRFEMRDPFTEVTYRRTKLAEIVAKAEALGSSRFVAIDANGRRSQVNKVDGEWLREPEKATRPQRGTRAAKTQATTTEAPRQRSAPPEAARPAPEPPPVDVNADAANERNARRARIEAALSERYLIQRATLTIGGAPISATEYRFRGDSTRVAFTESRFRLATDTNSPTVAKSMVDVAEARNWRAFHVSGSEDFKRLVWLEATSRGIRTIGYEPTPADLEALRKEQDARQGNRIQPARDVQGDGIPATATKDSARGAGGRKTVLVAIDAVLVARGIPADQREAVLAAAAEKLEQRTRSGRAPSVKVYDAAARPQRPASAPLRDVPRSQDRPAPAR